MSETPRYPVPKPPGGEDPRFTLGLLYDVAEVLPAHGYPKVRAGADLLGLREALFQFIYVDAGRAHVLADDPSRACAPTTKEEGSA